MDKLLTAIEVAEYLGCSDKTVYAWAQRGNIPSYKMNGLLRFKTSEVKAMVDGSLVKIGMSADIRPGNLKGDDVDDIIGRVIASVKGSGYNVPTKGKPDKSGPERR